jgi:hypothetical protein
MIKKLDWSNNNIYAYEASGKITKEEHLQIYSDLREGIKKHGKIRIYIQLPKMAWPDRKALGMRLRFARKYFKKIERYAVVSNFTFLDYLFRFINFITGLFTKIEYRHYSFDDELLARTWIQTKHIK